MATKQQWKDRAVKAKARVRQLRKLVKAGTKVLDEKQARIAQLESMLEADMRKIGQPEVATRRA